MATIQEVIQKNDWKSVTFLRSSEVNKVFTAGVVGNQTEEARAIFNGLSESVDNVQEVFSLGLSDFQWKEQNLGDASSNKAVSINPEFTTYKVKTFYGNQWWGINTIQRDLLNSSQPNRLVVEHVGRFWAMQYNKIIASTLSGMGSINAITAGSKTTNFSEGLVSEARSIKGDMAYDSKLATMFMNSKTRDDIFNKQRDGTIKTELIGEVFGQASLTPAGVSQVINTRESKLFYRGSTPVVVDDAMSDGIIALADEGSFAFAQKEFKSPLLYVNDPLSGNGAGSEKWGVKALYFLHPVGFNFTGTLGTDYKSKSGLTLAELKTKPLYELAVSSKLSPIVIIKVKIGK